MQRYFMSVSSKGESVKQKSSGIVKKERFELARKEKAKKLDKILYRTTTYYNYELAPETINLYHHMLDEYSIEKITNAIEELIKESDFFPKISQIIRKIKEQNPPKMIGGQDWLRNQEHWQRHALDVGEMKEIRREKLEISTSVKDLIDKIGKEIPESLSDEDREKQISKLRRQGVDIQDLDNQ